MARFASSWCNRTGRFLSAAILPRSSPNGGASVTRNHIARLNPDGTLDTALQPERERYCVFAIAVQTDGKILVGGVFTTASADRRAIDIARLDATTGLADSFDPNANEFVDTIAVQADGKILVGGDVYETASADRRAITLPGSMPRRAWLIRSTRHANSLCLFDRGAGGREDFGGRRFHNSIGGQTRNHIARLDPTTGLADSFDPNANVLSMQSRCRRTARFWRAALSRSEQHRRADAQSHRPARSHHRFGRFVRPERETMLSLPSQCRPTARFWRAD